VRSRETELGDAQGYKEGLWYNYYVLPVMAAAHETTPAEVIVLLMVLVLVDGRCLHALMMSCRRRAVVVDQAVILWRKDRLFKI